MSAHGLIFFHDVWVVRLSVRPPLNTAMKGAFSFYNHQIKNHMEKFFRRCVLTALIAFALLMIGDIPHDSLPLGAWIAQVVGFKTLGILAFSFAVTLNKEWRVYGYKK